MFSHLQELLSFEAGPTSPTSAKTEPESEDEVVVANDSHVSFAPPADSGMEEEPMEEIALEVTRSGGVIVPPPPGALAEDDSMSGSSAGAVVEGSKKRGIFSSFSKSKSRDSGVNTTEPDVESEASSDADSDGGKLVGIAAVPITPEKAPTARNSYRYKKETNKKGWLLCILVLLLITAIVVPCVILIPRNRDRSNEVAANTDSSNTDSGNDSDADSGNDSNTTETTAPPTAAPTVATNETDGGELPQECEPVYDSLDNCLLTEVTIEEADACIDCVWSFLPDNNGPCAQLESEVCNILSQCECLTCTDELQNYLDCQSECEIDCIF